VKELTDKFNDANSKSAQAYQAISDRVSMAVESAEELDQMVGRCKLNS
jgi:hypothetical protein